MPSPAGYEVRTPAGIAEWLQHYHQRLAADELMPTMAEIAEFCRVPRPTLYDALRGGHVSENARRRMSWGIACLESLLQPARAHGRQPLSYQVAVGRAGIKVKIIHGTERARFE